MLKYNNSKLIDLTHKISADIPTWSGEPCFSASIEFDYDDEGYRTMHYSCTSSTGTHMDAPQHFFAFGNDVSDIPLTDLMAPVSVIKVDHKVHQDYFISADDITDFEKQHGKIPGGIVVAYTGWSKRWQTPELYRNADEQGEMHFPGFSLEAAEMLLDRNIHGIGIDTFSPDGSNMEFPVHCLLLPQGKFILENLANLDQLPPAGASIVALPLKIEGGAESPIRAVGIIHQ